MEGGYVPADRVVSKSCFSSTALEICAVLLFGMFAVVEAVKDPANVKV